ncbi:uncharacterized protein LOC111057204 [Nilaparvata lugens]|uniref:uncharacterized protein LOC111057204 n=1 Tax=Nilaparvata lugens TaxID=108931 RepID=UPI00193DFE83|nr:uncharacterized protein LOC111057204 [Nilaparvata lugens]XP_039285873.1 uncharacterized protein LOC111057204 [Nilaparvata lugens]
MRRECQRKNKKWSSKDADGKKGGADAKYDSDNKSNANRRSYQGSTNSLAESAVSEAAASGKNKNKNHGHQENNPPTSAPKLGTSGGTSRRKATSKPPLLTNRNDVLAVEKCVETECILVLLVNLPQWFAQGHTYRIVYEAIGVWPYEIEMCTSMKHETVRYAKINFRNMDEALRCVNFYRNYVYMGRRLLCELNDEVAAGSNDMRSV